MLKNFENWLLENKYTALNTCKIKDFIWDGPCNYPKIASLDTPYTDSVKCLIYKEKRRFSAPLS